MPALRPGGASRDVRTTLPRRQKAACRQVDLPFPGESEVLQPNGVDSASPQFSPSAQPRARCMYLLGLNYHKLPAVLETLQSLQGHHVNLLHNLRNYSGTS